MASVRIVSIALRVRASFALTATSGGRTLPTPTPAPADAPYGVEGAADGASDPAHEHAADLAADLAQRASGPERLGDPATPPRPSGTTVAMNDRRVSWMVLVFGVLVLAGGVIGSLKGSVASAVAGGAIGLGLVGCGAAMLAGRRAALPAIALSFVTALAMAQRVYATGKLVPGLPVGVLAVAVTYVLLAERRRRTVAGRPAAAPPPPRA